MDYGIVYDLHRIIFFRRYYLCLVLITYYLFNMLSTMTFPFLECHLMCNLFLCKFLRVTNLQKVCQKYTLVVYMSVFACVWII
jgi:hypothetical protein